MNAPSRSSRRSFLAFLAATPFCTARVAGKRIPTGLELYSVRNQLEKDLMGTVRQVARMGYECVEFYAPYYDWTLDYAKRVRRELDGLRVRCYSTHNHRESFETNGISKAIELNQALGARYIVLAHPGEVTDLDGWRRVVDLLNGANETMARHGLHAGYHNHELEWKAVGGQKPMELLRAKTETSIMLQLDVGTCLEAGSDPVAWVEANPGRIRSMHCKDWSPARGYRVLFGEGVAPWKKLFAAAESTGGIEYYLIEQEESDFPELEAAERCLTAFRKLKQ
jgi:sugar phosphate isomerase/epimerase